MHFDARPLKSVNVRRLLLAVLLLLFSLGLWQILSVTNEVKPDQRLSRTVQYLVDNEQQLRIEDIASLAEEHWQTHQSDSLNFGLDPRPYWLRFSINSQADATQRMLEVDYALVDQLDIWFLHQGDVLAEYHGGDALPFKARTIESTKFWYALPEFSGSPLEVYIRAQSNGSLQLPINIWQQQRLLIFNGQHGLAVGLFFGFLLAMAVSNFFFFYTTGSRGFLFYCAYVVFLALTLLALHGIGYKYLWPENPWLQGRSIVLFGNLTIAFAVIFTRQLLHIKKYSQRLDSWAGITAGYFLLAALLSLVVPVPWSLPLFLLAMSLVVLLVLFASSWLWRRGEPMARIYVLAWLPLLVSGFLASLDNANLIDLGFPTPYLLMLAAAIETLLLAFLVAFNHNQQRQALATSQDRAQEELEYKVEERTLELQIALRELEESNRELEKKNTIDALTGVKNRRFFDKRYLAELRRGRREQTQFSVAMVDIDHFKQVNDTYGHLVGDECLRQVAELLQQQIKRPADEICRYGGEEFAIILPHTDKEGVMQLLEQMRHAVAETPLVTHAGPIQVTISAGCTTVAEVQHLENDSALLALADKALYRAKQDGRNCIRHQFFTPEVNPGDPHS